MLSAKNLQDLEKLINAYYGCVDTYMVGDEVDDCTFCIINTKTFRNVGIAKFSRKKWTFEED